MDTRQYLRGGKMEDKIITAVSIIWLIVGTIKLIEWMVFIVNKIKNRKRDKT